MHQRPTQPWGAVGMPQYFLFAWQVTRPILILFHQSRDDVFNDLKKKKSPLAHLLLYSGILQLHFFLLSLTLGESLTIPLLSC